MLKSSTLLCFMLGAIFTPALAQYPERPVRVIVPFAPGGNVDVTARTIVPALSEILGRHLVVDNRSGAGGAVGAELVATANPDGYTLLVGSTGLLAIAPVIFDKLRYHPTKDFSPISLISKVPLVMVVNPKLPAKTAKDFVALAKSRGGDITMGSSGNFSTGQLAGALFQNVTGTQFVHVPYKGGSLALTALIGSQVDVLFDQINSAAGHIRGGRVRALAVTSTARSQELPDVPTMSEAGVPGVEAETFNVLLAPEGTSRAIVMKLNDAVSKALATKSIRDSYAKQGAEVMGSTPEAAGAYIRSEINKWRTVIKTGGLKTEHR